MATSAEKELLALGKLLQRTAQKAMELQEWEIVDELAPIGRKISQKIQGHKAQRRSKRGK